jgi:hypothetical protein
VFRDDWLPLWSPPGRGVRGYLVQPDRHGYQCHSTCSADSAHDSCVKLGSKLENSALVASVNLLLAIAAFLSFIFPRFSGWGLGLIPITVLILMIAGLLILRDLWKTGTRLRAVFAVLLCLPVVMLYMILAVWEGPLYVVAEVTAPLRLRIQGPAGVHGLEIYGPDHQQAEWTDDDVGLVWRFEWSDSRRFPPMKVDFSYGQPPAGFDQKIVPPGSMSPPPLDPNLTYTLLVQPGMGMPEYFSLHGGQITRSKPDPKICWGGLTVPDRAPAIVRVDCVTRKSLPMPQRALDRLKAYQERRIPFY